MKYISTRGDAPELNFEDVIITGLARDGGLYVPETWPQLSPDQIRSFASMPYCDVAYEVMVPFVDGTIEDNVFKDIIAEAYAGFSHPGVVLFFPKPVSGSSTAGWLPNPEAPTASIPRPDPPYHPVLKAFPAHL